MLAVEGSCPCLALPYSLGIPCAVGARMVHNIEESVGGVKRRGGVTVLAE
jgi:hypothetical protein